VSGADLADNAEPYRDRVRVERRSVESHLALSHAATSHAATSHAAPYVGSGFSRTNKGRTKPTPITVIVDPPRTGLSKRALEGLLGLRPNRLVYVSCDVATLARDTRALVKAGYELLELSGVDLFPNTAHVEVLAVFAV
jgi:tRNA/tmRNA/rRNA uracil-C5-methylase (TrmA/RlmC/RlmD family)